jgi:DNA-directed RNA polymerase subunit L
MKINSLGNDAIQIQIDGEDYSVADIVHKELLGVKHVKFAGVAPPHPLIKTLTIQVHTDGGDANELLKQAVTNAQARTKEILDAAISEFPDAVKHSGIRSKLERASEPVAQPQEATSEQKGTAEQAPVQNNEAPPAV